VTNRHEARLSVVASTIPTGCPCGSKKDCETCDHVRTIFYQTLRSHVPHRLTQDDLIELIRSKIPNEMGGQAQLAEAVGVTPQNLNDVLNGRRPPGPTLLKAIGVKKSKVYELED
jgi:hypothetical protein